MRFFSKNKKLSKFLMAILVIATMATALVTYTHKEANACVPCISPFGCNCIIINACVLTGPDCMSNPISQVIGVVAYAALLLAHKGLRDGPFPIGMIDTVFRTPFNNYREWFSKDFFDGNVRGGLMDIGSSMTKMAMHQSFVIGTFFDAKQQLEIQRLFQELENEAYRNYQPSDDFCWFGTNVRSLAASESRGRLQSLALNTHSMNRHLSKAGTASATRDLDKAVRWQKFRTTYCDPQDNNWDEPDPLKEDNPPSGLMLACLNKDTGKTGAPETERINIDIDYGRLIDQRRTLDVSFDNPGGVDDGTGVMVNPPDREDVIALANNLYGHDVLTREIKGDALVSPSYQRIYMALRSVAARRNVAENSFNAIVEMKSSGGTDANTPSNSRDFLGAVLAELGMPADEIYNYIGENPSYYAQLEILAKKIYQNPDFYANLYDKPTNVERKSVALKAIELMLDRAIYESELRQEMVTSVLLSTNLDSEFKKVRSNFLTGGE